MRKTALFAFVVLLAACGGKGTKVQQPVENSTSVVEEQAEKPETIDTAAVRDKAAEELKSWGAKDAYFDKAGYLVYEVASSDLTASAGKVAYEMYKIFSDTPTLKGIRVVDYIDKTELGRYPKNTESDE